MPAHTCYMRGLGIHPMSIFDGFDTRTPQMSILGGFTRPDIGQPYDDPELKVETEGPDSGAEPPFPTLKD